MVERERRYRAMHRILGEIGRGTDRGDRVAAVIRIHEARRMGAITERDAERLLGFLTAMNGDRSGSWVL